MTTTPKMRGLFGKNSLPPPPAGRGPDAVPKPAGEAAKAGDAAPALPSLPMLDTADVPKSPVVGAPDLPSAVTALDDPLSDLFEGAPAQAVVIEDASEPPVAAATAAMSPVSAGAIEDAAVAHARMTGPSMSNIHEEPTFIPRGEELPFPFPAREHDSTKVAKLGLAKTMLASAAEEVMAHEPTRDPRSEDSLRPRANAEPEPSEPALFEDELPSPTAAAARTSLEGVVFDPDQSVARRLGEEAIDDQVGPSPVSDALRDLPLPEVKPNGMDDDDVVPRALPVRSMRPAMIVMALVLISGGAATLLSLGVLGGTPNDYRKRAPQPAQAPAASTSTRAQTANPNGATIAAPAAAPPAPVAKPAAAAEPAPVAEPAPEPPSAAEPAVAAAPPDAPSAPAPSEPTAVAPAEAQAQTSGTRSADGNDTLTQLQQALAADPRDHHAMEGLVKHYLAHNQARDAVPLAEQMVKKRPKRAAYRVMLGQALLGAGDRAAARQAGQDALALEPDNREAQRLAAL